uniref:Serine and arginine rich splicing factor 5 n=5 Tax=Neoaves TaxID=3078114 RepID=A0A8C3JLA1_9CHAR
RAGGRLHFAAAQQSAAGRRPGRREPLARQPSADRPAPRPAAQVFDRPGETRGLPCGAPRVAPEGVGSVVRGVPGCAAGSASDRRPEFLAVLVPSVGWGSRWRRCWARPGAAILWRCDGVGFSSLCWERGAGRRRVVGGAAGGTSGSDWRRLRRVPSWLLPIGPERGRGRAAPPAGDCGREGGGAVSQRAGPGGGGQGRGGADRLGAVSPAASSAATTAMSGCRVFIGRLNPAAREKDVERFFKGYGRIRDIDLKRGFGFVEFEDPRDADDAVYELDGKELCSERVTIEHARARSRGRGRGRYSDRFSSRRPRSDRRNAPPVRTENRLIVENLSSRVSWQPICVVGLMTRSACGLS